ncbi:cation transporter [Tetragenococcus halophilus]|uniref:Metal-binding protein n=1 Tax=Tetragenococcus halophilus (strain DSM 20338 / JCM 20259 / NCIMB 9735 / NBRC 12172) TaxID=945021 RepID=A0AAN1SGV1_TETHN|nr:cation transporter [Tetragenococcus halophilus]MCO8293094.1 cation transporter [Tetragenococcus halophilus]NRR75236.1 cation transporter [Tetragenococcus halophilus]QXN85987.1 cation transporter [Tetragenococcus halophilus]RQD32637.1 heavy metal-binding protein [Tetragenococcus halophilus subsp. halophilus DSM 20339]BAK94572.1 putative metal-binding protein [Tetragenococcus halophilus NBRC 12172]
MEKVIIQLGTLTCPSCMQKIEQAIKKEDGVAKVKVLFNASKVKVELDSSVTDAVIIQQTIKKLGYTVENTKTKELS